jgi:hypothetical protein
LYADNSQPTSNDARHASRHGNPIGTRSELTIKVITHHEQSEYATPPSSAGYVANQPKLMTLGKQIMFWQVT